MGHIIPDDPEEGSEPPKGGRRNAIVSYQTLARLDNLLAATFQKVTLVEQSTAGLKTTTLDHEGRIRVLETAVTEMKATSALSRWALPIALTAVSVLTAVSTFIVHLNK